MDHHLSRHGHGHEVEIPNPITSTYVVHHHHNNNALNNSSNNSSTEEDNNKKALVLAAAAAATATTTAKAVRYRECLKNHAASMGGTATDGCGEYMPSGQEGSLEALKCSACGCHRNFHRKEVEGEPSSCYYKSSLRNAAAAAGGYLGYMPRQQQQQQQQQAPALIMPLGAIHTSESDEIEDGGGPHPMLAKRRFRTKFTAEQKEKMLGFAERVGWKLQRQEEGTVQQFCQEIGVKRRVLKVWMHNNKHTLANKNSSTTTTNNISTPPQIQ